ncbi:MAG: sensor histidine kinase [Burkholderiales bacterium]|nr:sensor histidine kinase [Burkholderiales bacterium]
MPLGGAESGRAIILTTRLADSQVAVRVLNEAGIASSVCGDAAQLVRELSFGAGFVVITEDIATQDRVRPLQGWVLKQPAWSDIPIIVLTGRIDQPGRTLAAQQLHEALGNVTLLERPFHPTTLISVAHAALRSRRRQYEARELIGRYELLARELQHRTKNLLAVVLSIAAGSLKDGGGGNEAFVSRLHALAKAQDLLTEREDQSALLEDVIKIVLAGFGDRITLQGPQIYLKPSMAQGFALVVHELATNSAKHGALTSAGGTVAVRWSLLDKATPTAIEFSWQERGGPPAQQPTHRGFGSLLLKSAVASVSPPRFEYSLEGFAYSLNATLPK